MEFLKSDLIVYGAFSINIFLIIYVVFMVRVINIKLGISLHKSDSIINISEKTNGDVLKFILNTGERFSKVEEEFISKFNNTELIIDGLNKSLERISLMIIQSKNKITDSIVESSRGEISEIELMIDELLSEISLVKLENRVSFERAVAAEGEIVVKSGDVTAYFTNCRLARVEDAESGLITLAYYEDGFHRRSETTSGGTLKYAMEYGEDESLIKATEFDENGDPVYVCHYDQSGEIVEKISYLGQAEV